MKFLKFLPIILVLVALAYYFGIYQPQTKRVPNTQPAQLLNTGQSPWQTQSNDQPPITIKVTPVELGADFKQWKFDVIITTHSGDLEMDITKVATLVDDMGNNFQPVSWAGPGPGGHHRAGTLIFNSISPIPKYVDLKIMNVGGIVERSFRWDLQ